jgi:cell filamentation protein
MDKGRFISDRYDTSTLIEDQCEPGSRRRVLKNLLKITSKREMSRIETRELFNSTEALTKTIRQDQRFTAEIICDMHRMWLGSIYLWAGNYRQVNMSKGGFPFAAPAFIPKLMTEFEQNVLSKFTPCRFNVREEILYALAIVHVEFLLIHPFREGNGRLARLLSILMALQAGLPLLDFSNIKGKEKERYFAAVRAGLDRDYQFMETIFDGVLSRALRLYERASE